MNDFREISQTASNTWFLHEDFPGFDKLKESGTYKTTDLEWPGKTETSSEREW